MFSKLLNFICYILLFAVLAACGSGSDSDSEGSTATNCGPVDEIGPDDNITGMLEEGDCTAEQIYPDQSGGDFSFLDEYRVKLPANGTLTITMKSIDVDSFLFLVTRSTTCSEGCDTTIIIISDSNSGGGKDAFISMDLAAGDYGIHANSIAPKTGSYSLITTFTP
jgi:hypothetical protein